MATAVFDLDGTITRGDTLLPFLLYCAGELGACRRRLAALPWHVLMHKAGRMTNGQLKERFLQAVLSGVSSSDLRTATGPYLARLFAGGMNKAMVAQLAQHIARRDRVILATASPDIYVSSIAAKLGIPEVVCTQCELRDDRITGRIIGENCHGSEKLRRLTMILSDSEWSNSVIYTDHHSDLPILQRARQGVLVNPTRKARRLAKQWNFTIQIV